MRIMDVVTAIRAEKSVLTKTSGSRRLDLRVISQKRQALAKDLLNRIILAKSMVHGDAKNVHIMSHQLVGWLSPWFHAGMTR